MWFIQNLSAAETTDNLLTNNSFTTDTSDWELSDSNQEKVKRDPNTYNDSASKSIRFRYQDGNISQDVDISEVLDNHLVKEINMNFQSIGCGNTGGEWCYGGADDTIVNTITLSSTDTAEIITNTTAAPYEDGWSTYSFTEQVEGTFNTNDLNISLTITGNDSGNSSNWYGPIIDNINLTLTIEEYIAPIVVSEVVPETMIGGLDLSTEVTLDLIQDIQVMPEIEMNIAPIETIDMPEIELPNVVDIQPITEIKIEMPVDLPEIVEVEPIQEIQEIEIEEPLEVTVETETEQIEIEAEVKEAEVEVKADVKIEPETKEVTAPKTKKNERSKLSNKTEKVKETKNEPKKSVEKKDDKKETKKSKKKPTAKLKDKSVATKRKSTDKGRNAVVKDTPKAQIALPIEYLQVIQDTIIMTETIDLTQEMIYGREQEYNLNTSGITVVSLDNNSSSRWSNLQNESKRYQAPSYYRRSR